MNRSIVIGCLVVASVIIAVLCGCGLLGFFGYKSYIGASEEFLGTSLPKGYFPAKIAFNTKNNVTYKFLLLNTPSGNKITVTEGPLANNKEKKVAMLRYLISASEDNIAIEHVSIDTKNDSAQKTLKIGDKNYIIYDTEIKLPGEILEGASLIDNTKTHTRLFTYIPNKDVTAKSDFTNLLKKVFK